MNKQIKTIELIDQNKNIMGTMSLTLKLQGMRKAQEFTVYPISKDDTSKVITIQSKTRYGKLSLESGKLIITKPVQGGAYSHTFSYQKMTNELQGAIFTPEDLTTINTAIFLTADKNAGKSIIKCDNSGAVNIFSL